MELVSVKRCDKEKNVSIAKKIDRSVWIKFWKRQTMLKEHCLCSKNSIGGSNMLNIQNLNHSIDFNGQNAKI